MTTQIPSEFAGFVRETGVRAFDRLSTRSKELDAPLRTFVRSWSRLSEGDKYALFDELIATLAAPQEQIEPAPGAKQKRAVKRYDPEEVAATLPRKAKPKPAKPRAKKK